MRIDVNSFLGPFPFRRIESTTPEQLLAAMDRTGISEAWAAWLPAVLWRDPMEGNALLYQMASERIRPVPAIHPGLPGWESDLADAVSRQVPAVRCDPLYYGLAPTGREVVRLAAACGAAQAPLLLSVKLEDLRQRHPLDTAGDLPAAAVRQLIRSDSALRLIITQADRGFIEEVHFGSTPDEASRIWWDISWIWGPPEDHLATLLRTVGPERFLFGTGQPLRLPETSVARLDLLDLAPRVRSLIESDNARALAPVKPA
ncbi:MAG TPA: hypothetical protein VFL95_11160 [Gemmatimonadales bacterium]|nr:hypothetical protein [Gemmatimonadales bacterium]